MDCYEIWFNLRDSARDVDFSRDVAAYLGHLKSRGSIESYRLRRRKLGFGPPELGEFVITIETRDLAQLDSAFQSAASRTGEVETLHRKVYSAVCDVRFALWRDFPDHVRE